MIKLEVNDKCNECPCFVPFANKIYCDETVVTTIITCEHGAMCNHLEEYLKRAGDIKKQITIDGKEVAKDTVKYSSAQMNTMVNKKRY